ncbi:nucleoside deaminase [Ahniella affigens]|uniref:Nucleoside deaminase n=1 Tax=Ahniella affigens TaxID=2021234 RepID=A0A2P1PXX3_9GAMM|nr:nucleoside deaminase [Ahniella affigens]AVP99680.1 nucleoside deaminase [Ahniella affigens]
MLYAQVHLTLPAWVFQEVDTDRPYHGDDERMALAAQLARRNVEMETGGPFGAAIFDGNGKLVSVGVNRVVPQSTSLAHAEIMAFMTAQQRLQRFRLNQDGGHFSLYTSAQPCCQCYGASFWAGIDELVIGARADDVHELTEFDEGPLPTDWIGELQQRGVKVRTDVLRQTCREVLAAYQRGAGVRY